MTVRSVPVPRLLAVGLVFFAVFVVTLLAARQVNRSTSARCTPQGGCVDPIDRPHVAVRVVP